MSPESIVKDVLTGMIGIGGIPTNQEFYDEFDFRLKAALGVTGSVDNWINVNDRLPDFRQRVLCYYIGHQPKMSGPEIGILYRLEVVKPHREKNQFSMCREVLYWQPLPEGPKKES